MAVGVCIIGDNLGNDEQPRAATCVAQRALGRTDIDKISSLTDRNMVATSIDKTEITIIFNSMTN